MGVHPGHRRGADQVVARNEPLQPESAVLVGEDAGARRRGVAGDEPDAADCHEPGRRAGDGDPAGDAAGAGDPIPGGAQERGAHDVVHGERVRNVEAVGHLRGFAPDTDIREGVHDGRVPAGVGEAEAMAELVDGDREAAGVVGAEPRRRRRDQFDVALEHFPRAAEERTLEPPPGSSGEIVVLAGDDGHGVPAVPLVARAGLDAGEAPADVGVRDRAPGRHRLPDEGDRVGGAGEGRRLTLAVPVHEGVGPARMVGDDPLQHPAGAPLPLAPPGRVPGRDDEWPVVVRRDEPVAGGPVADQERSERQQRGEREPAASAGRMGIGNGNGSAGTTWAAGGADSGTGRKSGHGRIVPGGPVRKRHPCHPRGIRSQAPRRWPSRGSDSVKTEPCPGVLFRAMRPPRRSAVCRAMVRPRPVPPTARERAGSTR